MIGQEHITKTLMTQIQKCSIGHAYLFCGSRGTGKTSAAKIFAKAVNCTDKMSAPCGVCDVCVSLQNSISMDILEIDAASNNGVDEVRILRESVKFTPVSGSYKVYIIDEVHMLSNSAFNALLKTLEEPPKHAIFILATTEVFKLPATILSRCMRFDFRLVEREVLSKFLTKILKQEKKQADKDAVDYIAMRAEGSVRDCLSIADSLLSQDKLTLNNTMSLLGATDKKKVLAVLQQISLGEIGTLLQSIDDLSYSGASFAQLAKDISKFARDTLIAKTVKNCDAILAESKETLDLIKSHSKDFDTDFLISVINAFSAVDSELRYSISPRLVLETVALNACVRMNVDLSSIQDRLSRLEEYLKAGNINTTSLGEQKFVKQNLSQTSNPQIDSPSTPSFAKKAVKVVDAMSVWGKIATWIRTNSTPSNFNLVANHTSVSIADNTLTVSVADSKINDFKDISDVIKTAIKTLGFDLGFAISKQTNGIDIDSELKRIKSIIGDTPVNIKK
jgi:DNA polymerase-3 subunit gamma/tau